MPLSSNIKRIRHTVGLTQVQFAAQLGVARSTVTQWENGWSCPRMAMVHRIASALGVSAAVIVGDGNDEDLSSRAICPTASGVATSPLRARSDAGSDEPEIRDTIELPQTVGRKHPGSFFLEVDDDGMNRIYPAGSVILVDPEIKPENGSIAAVSIDGATYVVRRVYQTARTLVLSAESWSTEYDDLVITHSDNCAVRFLGVVVWFQARQELL